MRFQLLFQKIRNHGLKYAFYVILNNLIISRVFYLFHKHIKTPEIIYPVPSEVNKVVRSTVDSAYAKKIILNHKIPTASSILNDVTLTGFWAIPYLRDGGVIVQHYSRSRTLDLMSRGAMFRLEFVLLSLLRREKNLNGIEFATSFVCQPNRYGHWLTEHLIKLKTVFERYESGKSFPKIVVRKNPPHWMIDSLTLAGVPESDIIQFNHSIMPVNRYLHIYPADVTHNVNLRFNPMAYRWLRRRYYNELNISPESKTRIYLSKQSRPNKYVKNFTEIEPILEKFDFQIIEPEKKDFETVVCKLSEAEIVVGPQGSNMHNIIFASDAKILDLKPGDRDVLVSKRLAKSVNCDYHDLIGGKSCTLNNSFYINPGSLESKLNKLLD